MRTFSLSCWHKATRIRWSSNDWHLWFSRLLPPCYHLTLLNSSSPRWVSNEVLSWLPVFGTVHWLTWSPSIPRVGEAGMRQASFPTVPLSKVEDSRWDSLIRYIHTWFRWQKWYRRPLPPSFGSFCGQRLQKLKFLCIGSLLPSECPETAAGVCRDGAYLQTPSSSGSLRGHGWPGSSVLYFFACQFLEAQVFGQNFFL